uniref:Protein phosphatase 1 regulatory subunit 35 n=2 Tax=Podarcis muralis TaxID=64176 RepID=A0A670J4N5_PODMU|nr:protein phosphatase 1 regulatory subunit 35 isoform X1 [Podarcis muralis]
MALDRAFSGQAPSWTENEAGPLPFAPPASTVPRFFPVGGKDWSLDEGEAEKWRGLEIKGACIRPMMAAAPTLTCSDDTDSLPCAAPVPLPPPTPQGLVPEPEMVLTPERACVRRPGGGILRRHQQGKAHRRQVRFRLGSKSDDIGLVPSDPLQPGTEVAVPARRGSRSDDVRMVSLNPPKPRVEVVHSSAGESPITITLAREPSLSPAGEEKEEEGEEGSCPPRNPLAGPVPHSTLALVAEVHAVREQGFNARQAAEQLVQRSFVARCAVEARAGEGMNIRREQQLYQGLVSLEVPEVELLSSAVQEKLALVRTRPEPRKELDCTGPDLLAFYDPEQLFTESPFLEVEGLPPLKLQPRTRDPATTFFMYRKLRQWDS